MTLGDKRRIFARLVPRLIDQAHELGFEVTIGDVVSKLGIDIDLFRRRPDGRIAYLRSTESHRELGEWWEQQHELCRWGGRFTRPDGNHYSCAHGGRA